MAAPGLSAPGVGQLLDGWAGAGVGWGGWECKAGHACRGDVLVTWGGRVHTRVG